MYTVKLNVPFLVVHVYVQGNKTSTATGKKYCHCKKDITSNAIFNML